MPSWDELSRPGPKEGGQESPEQKRFAELCATVFSSGAGAELIKLMRARTIERRTPANAPDYQFRGDEAVRRFVEDIETQRDRGIAAKPKAT
jgi:hypothetical protein